MYSDKYTLIIDQDGNIVNMQLVTLKIKHFSTFSWQYP